MVPWWKRLIYSFVSTLVASSVCGSFFELVHLMDHNAHFQVSGLFWFIFAVLVFALAGWLLAVPVVLTVKNIHGRRMWFLLAVGSCIAPIVILGFEFVGQLIDPHSGSFWAGTTFFVLAAAVSCITTIIYLMLIRRADELRVSN